MSVNVNNILDVDEMSDVVDDIPTVVNQASFSLEETRPCTQPDDKTFLDLIGQAFPYPAIEFLKEVQSFSQAALDSGLILACQRGFKYLVQKLVHLGADIECQDASGKTPLLICVENRYYDLVRFLVASRADVKAVDCAGNNALILSISFEGSKKMARFLLRKANIMINHQNNDGYTAVMKALEVMDVGLLKLLLETYLFKNCTELSSDAFEDDKCWTFLDRTVNCKGETVQQIAEKHGMGAVLKCLQNCLVNGTSPVLAAVEACDLETLNFWLVPEMIPEYEINQAFWDIFSKHYFSKKNPLSRETLPIIKRLMECVTNLKSPSGYSLDPVSAVVDAGDYDMVELLCKHGAPLNPHKYESDRFPPSVAAKNGRMDLIELLLKYKMVVNTYSFHNSPLDCALSHGHIDCAKFLVNHGAKMNISLAISSVMMKQDTVYMKFLLQNYKNETIRCVLENAKNGRNLLTEAMKSDNLDFIEQILQAGVDVNIPQRAGATPIVESKNGAVALLLIRYGADVNHVTDTTNETPLMHVLKKFSHYSYRRDSYTEEVVQVLLENGASVRARTRHGTTPLMLAAKLEGHKDILQTLLHHGADCSDQDNDGNTALLHAILGRYSENTIILIQSMKNNIDLLNLRNNKLLTALMCAVYYDNSTIISVLIDRGADINITDANGNTVLHHAVASAKQKHLRVLINGGCDINHQNSEGLSPLMLAALSCGDYRSISTLVDLRADMTAVSYDKSTIMSELIDCGADVNITDANGNTALHLAVASAKEKFLKVLINGGCDINHQNNDGLSPLMLAALNCDYCSVSTLVNLGADVNAVSCKNVSKTAISFVPKKHYDRSELIKCIEVLLEKGANASFLCPWLLPAIITEYCSDIIPKLIQCGLGPSDIHLDDIPHGYHQRIMLFLVSPLCLTLLVDNVSLARYFWRIMFMTNSDLCLPANKIVRYFLQRKQYKECLSFLDEVSSHPMSLFKMCFVAVTSAVGASPGREAKVNKLPLPWVVKDMLLFKSINGDHNSNIPFDVTGYVCSHEHDYCDV